LLKQFAEKNYVDHDLLDIYSLPLVEFGQRLYQSRRVFLEAFAPYFRQQYAFLSSEKEPVAITYESDVARPEFAEDFKLSRYRDLPAQRTTLGAHRDDFLFEVMNFPLKKYGSQGQQKTFLIALKLAQFEFLKKEKQYKPLLLLDDIFDKLDDKRIAQLLELVQQDTFGQVFLTDARPERTQFLFQNLGIEARYLEVRRG
jgi:DNA replication and repair protein RecF